MMKVEIKKLSGATARQVGAKASTVKVKRISNAEGSKRISTLDAGNPNFGDDLTFVFGRNVARARRENKRVTGALDRVPAKP
jgi:hypothetical protein